MEQECFLPKSNPEPKAEEKNKDNEKKTVRTPSLPKSLAEHSVLGPVTTSLLMPKPQHQLQQVWPNPLPANVHALTFEEKVESLSKLLCDSNELKGLELVLTNSGLRVSTDLVENVLKKSYKAGNSAKRFFDCARSQLGNKHSPYAWNLLVDILGNSKIFDVMWEAVKSMKGEGILSRHTFASVFTCYAMADKVKEAIMTFEVMEKYGCAQDVGAFNSLLCALCFLRNAYAILLEGWEKEGDVAGAKKTFAEMIVRLGWDAHNTAAYNALLGTLCKGGQVDESLKFLDLMRSWNCFTDKSFYSTAIHGLSLQNKSEEAELVFDMMLRFGYQPSNTMYNSMISAYCYAGRTEDACWLLDGKVGNGAFPDSVTYAILLEGWEKEGDAVRAKKTFGEMLVRLGWDPRNTAAYNAFLRTLWMGGQVDECVKFVHVMRSWSCFPDKSFYSTAIHDLSLQGKAEEAALVFDTMLQFGYQPSNSRGRGQYFSRDDSEQV
ncbi:hypothetical protein KI387_011520 [Taxus chinensis]|uniref:Pentatricopeptide repeat-containing protein n=1 Tax=Taxus chinensis TaxID=29808 RepID=A0AA38FFD2_TAXCH|nr:hypothetical protein KI387_011520 [Taxus chinensis]